MHLCSSRLEIALRAISKCSPMRLWWPCPLKTLSHIFFSLISLKFALAPIWHEKRFACSSPFRRKSIELKFWSATSVWCLFTSMGFHFTDKFTSVAPKYRNIYLMPTCLIEFRSCTVRLKSNYFDLFWLVVPQHLWGKNGKMLSCGTVGIGCHVQMCLHVGVSPHFLASVCESEDGSGKRLVSSDHVAERSRKNLIWVTSAVCWVRKQGETSSLNEGQKETPPDLPCVTLSTPCSHHHTNETPLWYHAYIFFTHKWVPFFVYFFHCPLNLQRVFLSSVPQMLWIEILIRFDMSSGVKNELNNAVPQTSMVL